MMGLRPKPHESLSPLRFAPRSSMTLPLWAIGLVLAGAAPFIVRVIADALEARAKKKTQDMIEKS